MKKHLKIIIILLSIIAICLIITLVVLNKKETPKNNIDKNEVSRPIVTTKKISNYVDIISGDYYMKYKTHTVDEKGEEKIINAEYAISKERMILNYEDYLTSTLVTKEGAYYIMHENKAYVKYPVDEEAQKGFSGFKRGYTLQVFEDSFLGTGTEDIEGNSYYYEEYKDTVIENAKVRYYFDQEDNLKYIKNITSTAQELTEVLKLNKEVYEKLFELPKDYKLYDINELSNTTAQ